MTVTMNLKELNYINGKWEGENAEKLPVYNPSTEGLIGHVPKLGKVETIEAINAAHNALEAWSNLTAYERSAYLKRLNELMLENINEIAQIMTMEMGKPFQEACGEVRYAASYIEWFAEEGKRVYGETIPSHHSNKRLQVWKKPIGVVAAITPWNFPAAMITRKLGAALSAGCTVVVKPALETPFTAIKLVELCEKAGIPNGVINLVTGSSSEIGEAFMNDERVRKITFTGSTKIGKLLMKQAADQMKRVSLELGGHAPIIVLDDANLELAVKQVIASKFRNAGQTCVCGNRIYVQGGIYEEFIKKLTAAVEDLTIGDGMEQGVQIGPLINHKAVEKVDYHVRDALSKGAKVLTGGKKPDIGSGSFYMPTVLGEVNHEMVVMNEETFGPVAPVQKITTDQEAIELANQSPYGLAAYVFTESVSRGTRIIEKLDCGIVGWNDGAPAAAQAPFGGVKESGLGREGGHQGLEEFLEIQYVSIGI
ncbi:NAD-dependent succinate-semialdehyde dehydrogenase [Priestia endophytica]|uniref:NAD-dependent succinate-semialdehyde dehydrogenase n=1 Tax=Priestia endophytica TaxID=135735 RepID=UPI00241316D9|nr:NAD-dependent succinate-semialdehyde dehydrogenase [Priestia endophytica]